MNKPDTKELHLYNLMIYLEICFVLHNVGYLLISHYSFRLLLQ